MTIEELLYYKDFLKFDSENNKIQIKENELPKFHINDVYIFDKGNKRYMVYLSWIQKK